MNEVSRQLLAKYGIGHNYHSIATRLINTPSIGTFLNEIIKSNPTQEGELWGVIESYTYLSYKHVDEEHVFSTIKICNMPNDPSKIEAAMVAIETGPGFRVESHYMPLQSGKYKQFTALYFIPKAQIGQMQEEMLASNNA